jgi:VanZ family protein
MRLSPVGGPKNQTAARLCFLVVAGLILAYTLAPFEFSPGSDIRSRASEILSLPKTGEVLKTAGHVLAFFVLGGLAVCAHSSALLVISGQRRLIIAAAGFCLVLECLQFLVVGRHPRAFDLAVNTAAACAGAWMSRRWSRRTGTASLDRPGSRLAGGIRAGIFLTGVTAWMLAGLLPIPRLWRLEWNPDFRLLICNEADGSEPWLGEIRFLGLYERALSPMEIRAAFAENSEAGPREPRSEPGLLAGYDFTCAKTNVLRPTGSLEGSSLSLTVPADAEWMSQGGLLLKSPTVLTAGGADSRLTDAITRAGSFSLTAWIRPLAGLHGPARLVSLSGDAWSRNFMLGQESRDLLFRVRNGIMAENGVRHELRLVDRMDDRLQFIAATYDHGVVSIFRDGRLLGPVLDLREPNVHLALGSGPGGYPAAGVLLLLFVGLPLCPLWAGPSARLGGHLKAVGLTCVIGALPYGLSYWVVGGPWRPGLVLVLAILPALLYPLCLSYLFGQRHGGDSPRS